MNCQQFREMIDSYISDELLVETNHEVLHHLENCPACRRELSARRGLRTKLRSAVRNSPEMQINPNFAANLRNNLRETALRPTMREKLSGAAFVNFNVFASACILLTVLIGAFWILRRSSPEIAYVDNKNSTNKINEILQPAKSPINEAVQIAQHERTQTAIGDHKNCALKFNLAEKPITLAEAAEKYGRMYKDLDAVVKNALRQISAKKTSGKTTDKIEFLEAHSCVFNNLRFAHIVLRRGKNIISLLVTDADSPHESDENIMNQTDDGLQVAQFRSKRFEVFVVSDLSEQENSTVAEMLSPAVVLHIERAEA